MFCDILKKLNLYKLKEKFLIMKIARIILSSIFCLSFVSHVHAQSGSIGKKINIDDDFSIEFTEIKRTGQGALMVKYNIEKKAGLNISFISCNNSKITDLATKAVYHNMEGAATSAGQQYFRSGNVIKCWNMISEPPTTLKSAVFLVSDLAPVEIEIP